jgi:hypothetical protein
MTKGLKLLTSWQLAENSFYLTFDRWQFWNGKNLLEERDQNTINFMFEKCEELLKKRELTKKAWKEYTEIYQSIEIFLNQSRERSGV